MSINLVVQEGVVKSPALRYGADGKAEFRFTLVQTEKEWPLYLPCCAVGAAAERLASALEDGQHIVVTSGKLCYKKRQTKGGEASRMEVLVWTVDQLTTVPARAHEPLPADTREGGRPRVQPRGGERPSQGQTSVSQMEA